MATIEEFDQDKYDARTREIDKFRAKCEQWRRENPEEAQERDQKNWAKEYELRERAYKRRFRRSGQCK